MDADLNTVSLSERPPVRLLLSVFDGDTSSRTDEGLKSASRGKHGVPPSMVHRGCL